MAHSDSDSGELSRSEVSALLSELIRESRRELMRGIRARRKGGARTVTKPAPRKDPPTDPRSPFGSQVAQRAPPPLPDETYSLEIDLSEFELEEEEEEPRGPRDPLYDLLDELR